MSAYSIEGASTCLELTSRTRSNGNLSGFLGLVSWAYPRHVGVQPYFNAPTSCWALSKAGEQYCFPSKCTQIGHAASCATIKEGSTEAS